MLLELQVMSPEVKGESHPQRCTSIPVQVSVPKALRKKPWVIARVMESRHLPYTIHKNTKWNAESLFQDKNIFVSGSRREEGEIEK